jgi:formimidoylglutamate deiminase
MESFARLHDASRRHIRHAYPDYAIGVAPHSLRAVDPGSLNDVTTLASKDEIIHIHLAEQEAEIRETLAHLGARPVEWLLQHQDIGPRWCCVHCTQMTAQETQALAASGAVAGLCPITEANLGDGIFNAVEFAAAGGRFGIGSDSNVHITLFEELCLLEYSQRLRDHSRAALAQAGRSTGRVLYETALAGGAQAAARDSGSISPGAVADLVALTSDNEWLCGRVGDPALDSLIFSGRGRNCVRDVWSAGRHVVKEGRHVARDRIVGNFIRVMQTLSQDFPL